MVCFTVCIAFQAWEFVGSHDDPARARSLFKSVRAGWVKVGILPQVLDVIPNSTSSMDETTSIAPRTILRSGLCDTI